MKALTILTIIASLASGDVLAGETGPMPAPPAAHSFTVGALRVTALRDSVNVVPNDGSVFGKDVGSNAVAALLRGVGLRTDRILLSVDALLVRSDTTVVLIDTGLGPAIPGSLGASLAEAGVKPEDISTVLITHVHGDHIGGLITVDGNSVFRNAEIKIANPDWIWLQKQPEMKQLSSAISHQVKVFDPGEDVAAGITSVPIAGHTPGHVGYMITSKGESLLDIGDTAHSSIISLIEPEWTMGYDNDAEGGKSSRRRILNELSQSRQLVFAPHFPFPGVGWIERENGHFKWLPKR